MVLTHGALVGWLLCAAVAVRTSDMSSLQADVVTSSVQTDNSLQKEQQKYQS